MGVARIPGHIGDPDLGAGVPHGLSLRVYGGLLRAYPARFRARYADEMVQLFADQLRDASATGGVAAATATWFRTLLDLASSAAGEHLRKDRTMAQSLATFEPTRTMRLLGLFGVVGAVLLLWAFVSFNPFADAALNQLRLTVFALAGAAICLAFHRRQASVAPTLAVLTTGAVVISGLWYVTWILLAPGVESPHIGTFGFVNLLAGIALWVSPAAWAIGQLHTGAVWQGMARNTRVVTKLGLAILIGSMVGWLGDDRLGLVDSLWGEMWQAVALAGVAMNGVGWLLLGAVLLFGGRATRAGA